MTASGWVPWESLTNRTPSTRPTGCEPVLDAGEPGGGAPDRVGRDAEQEADGDRGERVGDVVAARDRELVDRHDPAARAGRRGPAAGQRQPLDGGRDDPAVEHAEAAGHGAVVAGTGPRGAVAETRVAADDRVLGVEHERAVRVDELRQPPLDAPVRLDRAVAVEVVGGDVRVDRDGRARATASAAAARTAR